MGSLRKLMLIVVLALNIAGAANMYDKYLNISFGFHIAIIICLTIDLLEDLLRTNVTINNNFNDNRS